jgi:hypothetical protein
MKSFPRSLQLLTLLSFAAAQACSAPASTPTPTAATPAASATATPGAVATTAPTAVPTAQVTPAVTLGAPAIPTDETDADDLEDGVDDWDDFDWEEESADYDWAESDDEVALDLAVRDIDYFGGSDEDNDGDTDYHALAYVSVGDDGEHQIELDEDDKPLSSDEPDVLRLTDKASGDAATFAADQEFNGFTIQNDGEELAIEFSEDDTILVEGKEYDGIDAAAQAIVAHPVGQSISLHSLAFLQGLLLRRPAEESRGAPACNPPAGASLERQDAQVYRLPVRYRVQTVQDPAAERPHALVKAVIALRRGE